MKRREFLKRAGAGSVALATVPILGETASAAGLAREFQVVALSFAQTVDGVAHTVAMNGTGQFNPKQDWVTGHGSFVHFDNAPPAPKPVIASGKWEAVKFLSYEGGFGSYGLIDAAILEIRIRLFPEGAEPVNAKLELVCNIGPAGITTGEEEGFVLTIPGAPQGPFVQASPAVGITHLSKKAWPVA